MSDFYTLITKIGKSKLANAPILGQKLILKEFAVGDGTGRYYNISENQTSLKNETWRNSINTVKIDDENNNWIIIETILPANIGGFTIREAGVFDDEGDLIAIGKYPETYKPSITEGSAKDLVIRMILEITNTQNVTLKIDPTVMLATQKDIRVLEQKIKNINVPVESVNSKTGKIELTALDIKRKDGSTLEEFAEKIKDDYEELTKKTDEVFQFGVKAKEKVVTALSSKKVNVTTNNNWQEISNAIGNIKLGDYSKGDFIKVNDLGINKEYLKVKESSKIFDDSKGLSFLNWFDCNLDKYYYGLVNFKFKKNVYEQEYWMAVNAETGEIFDMEKGEDEFIRILPDETYVKLCLKNYYPNKLYRYKVTGEKIWEKDLHGFNVSGDYNDKKFNINNSYICIIKNEFQYSEQYQVFKLNGEEHRTTDGMIRALTFSREFTFNNFVYKLGTRMPSGYNITKITKLKNNSVIAEYETFGYFIGIRKNNAVFVGQLNGQFVYTLIFISLDNLQEIKKIDIGNTCIKFLSRQHETCLDVAIDRKCTVLQGNFKIC